MIAYNYPSEEVIECLKKIDSEEMKRKKVEDIKKFGLSDLPETAENLSRSSVLLSAGKSSS